MAACTNELMGLYTSAWVAALENATSKRKRDTWLSASFTSTVPASTRTSSGKPSSLGKGGRTRAITVIRSAPAAPLPSTRSAMARV